MNVYREGTRETAARAYGFRRRGSVAVAVVAFFVGAFLVLGYGVRVHLGCSRSADRCTWEVLGLEPTHGDVRLSAVGALLVDRDGHGRSELTFATTNGRLRVTRGSTDAERTEQQGVAAGFTRYLMSRDEAFDAAYGPPAWLVAVLALTAAAVALWVARGGPWARVTLDPRSQDVTVVRRDRPWLPRETTTLPRAQARVWRGAYELYDADGRVVVLPARITDPLARSLVAALARD